MVYESHAQAMKEGDMSQETVYFQKGDVTITSTRATLGAKTYAIADVKSASLGVIPVNRAPGIILATIGGLISTASTVIVVVALILYGSDPSLSCCIGPAIIATLMSIFGIVRAVRAKPKYAVRVGSVTGESDALVSEDEPWAREIVQAMNRAIIERG